MTCSNVHEQIYHRRTASLTKVGEWHFMRRPCLCRKLWLLSAPLPLALLLGLLCAEALRLCDLRHSKGSVSVALDSMYQKLFDGSCVMRARSQPWDVACALVRLVVISLQGWEGHLDVRSATEPPVDMEPAAGIMAVYPSLCAAVCFLQQHQGVNKHFCLLPNASHMRTRIDRRYGTVTA